MYVDFSKAFDKVDHVVLINKLESYGITGKFSKWIKDFLSERNQTVYVNNVFSYSTLVQSGVPQGSVLGPLLFIVYINDLSRKITNSSIFTFADDTKLVSRINRVEDTRGLQKDLNEVTLWSDNNNMELNNSKFELITHGQKESQSKKFFNELPFSQQYSVYNVSPDICISPSSVVRDLGVYIDSDINWNYHRNLITQKAKQICAWSLSVFHTRDRTTMLTLLKSLIRPKLEYCCELWHPFKIKDIAKVEKIQRAFTFRIRGMQGLNYWDRLKALNLMSLQRRREKVMIMHVWKIKNYAYPNSVKLDFKLHLRSNCMKAVVKPLPRTSPKIQTMYDESFEVKAAKLWNVIPAPLTHITDLQVFKYKLNQFLSTLPDKPPIPGYPTSSNNSLTEISKFEVL